MPIMVRLGIPANAVSIGGFLIGAGGAVALARASGMGLVALSFALSVAWLLADSLDGMIARCKGTATAFGRELDGMCDHGVFLLLYVALASAVVDRVGWRLVLAAAVTHVVQANLYEAERGRFKRRAMGATPLIPNRDSRNPLVRIYSAVATWLDAWAQPFEQVMAGRKRGLLVSAYRSRATGGFRVLTALSADARILILFAARFLGHPGAFCWIEIAPMSIATAIGIVWHRAIERKAMAAAGGAIRTGAT